MADIEEENKGDGPVKVSAKEFGAKFRSKYEVYRFLTVDACCYLSSYQTVSIYFLKDLATGTKKRKLPIPHVSNFGMFVGIDCKDVQYLYVPMYEGLSIDAILK